MPPSEIAELRDFISGELRKVHTRFDGIDTRLDGMDKRFDGIDTRLDGMDKRFDGIDTRLDGMDKRFDGIDTRFDGIETRWTGSTGGIDTRLDSTVWTGRSLSFVRRSRRCTSSSTPFSPMLPTTSGPSTVVWTMFRLASPVWRYGERR
jgi:archaellum component FlaC